MKKKYQTIKVWTDTLKKLRTIYAETGDPMVKILDNLISDELQRIKGENEKSSI